ncbi:MAG TPA: FISUMP domain-containing protein [bacterium]|nr:FISUMP domain-containing protein [bacterium]HPN43442.1 FISUMP domain-containing protein [bacterium]
MKPFNFLFLVLIILFSSCSKDDKNPVKPKETVAAPTFSPVPGTYTSAQSVTITCATTGADIYYTTTGADPTTSSTKYSGAITISSTTTLKARAYITDWTASDVGIGLYEIITFVTDIDGNIYQIIKIGNQLWMAEDLRVTHYRNGEPIPNVTDNSQWDYLTSGAYCYYADDSSYATTYGALYNWYAVNDTRNLAPTGWHVPTDREWQTLVDYLGGDDVAGGKLKETGTEHWESPNEGATNASGFTSRPGGGCRSNGRDFCLMGYVAIYWSATDDGTYYALSLELAYNDSHMSYFSDNKQNGFSIRLVLD